MLKIMSRLAPASILGQLAKVGRDKMATLARAT
jgi:hypothetical protein